MTVKVNTTTESTVSEELSQKPEKKEHPLKRAANIVSNILFAFFLLILVFLVFCMVQSRLTGNPPSIAGHQMYIVLGGSMSPAFEAGSLAIIKPVDTRGIVIGDIITYRSASGGDGLTTHRVMENHDNGGQLSFTTRGDANEINDHEPVLARSILGRVIYAIPYAGFVMNFAQTKTGLILMVIIPGILIIFFELRYLLRYADDTEKKKAVAKTQTITTDE